MPSNVSLDFETKEQKEGEATDSLLSFQPYTIIHLSHGQNETPRKLRSIKTEKKMGYYLQQQQLALLQNSN